MVWVQPWAVPLCPLLPRAVLQPWQDLQWLKLLLHLKCMSDEVFSVVFPRRWQGKGWAGDRRLSAVAEC